MSSGLHPPPYGIVRTTDFMFDGMLTLVCVSGIADQGELLIVALIVFGCVTKSKLDNAYGCKHSLPDGIVTQSLCVCHST